MWPLVIYHKVGELSPLYTLHPEHLDKERFEIIVKVSGVRSESGGTIFSTTSYTNTEVSWGQVILNIFGIRQSPHQCQSRADRRRLPLRQASTMMILLKHGAC